MPRKMAREASPSPTPAENIAELRKELRKIDMVRELLLRAEGASLAEMIAATGWQPHTVRAALTGLRKRGHTIAKSKPDGVTRYCIVEGR